MELNNNRFVNPIIYLLKQLISLYHIWQYHRALKSLERKGLLKYTPELVRMTPQGNMVIMQMRKFKNIKEEN